MVGDVFGKRFFAYNVTFIVCMHIIKKVVYSQA